MKKKVAIIGLGYIGLPTAVFFALKGIEAAGADINPKTVEKVNNGENPIFEPTLDDMVKQAVSSKKLRAATVPEQADAFIIAVPTPFKENHEPDISYVLNAVGSIANVVKSGDIIILESTSPVGTTEIIAKKLQELRPDLKIPTNSDEDGEIFISYCPERMIPGNVFELIKNDRIIGGINEKSALETKKIYELIIEGQIFCTNSRTAEMSKLTENSFRDVNIAFANELSIICDKIGINVFELIKLANHHPRVNILTPSCGVGGHCIAVDPWFIISQTPEQSKLLHTARLINDYKPQFVLGKVDEKVNELISNGKSINEIKIACLGLSFKPNIDDLRESPAIKIASILSQKYPNVISVEPHIKELPEKYKNSGIKLESIEKALTADIIVPLVKHKAFINLDLQDIKEKLVDYIGLNQ